MCSVSVEKHLKFFNIFNEQSLHEGFFTSESSFGILRLLAASNGWSASDLAYLFCADEIMRQIAMIHYYEQKHTKRYAMNVFYQDDQASCEINYETTL